MTDAITSGGDPFVGNLATPLNSSGFSKAFINALPAYRAGLSANRRGLEIGMAHGFFLYGPFAITGPLRNSELYTVSGLLATLGMVGILTIALSLYGNVMNNPPAATLTTPNPPEALATREGWGDFGSGFFLGGCGGAFFAYFLCITPHVETLLKVAGHVWSVS